MDSVNHIKFSHTDSLDEGVHEALHGNETDALGGVTQSFLDYFGLHEQPFGVTPDPRFLYLGSKHLQALAALNYGTRSNRGFMALIAQPGMGKTSLLFQYLESLRDVARTAFVFQTDGSSTDFMRYLLADLGLNGTGKDLAEMRTILNEVLVQEMNAGRRFVLVIDEAQNLEEKTLESIRLLSNFETPGNKLMQIVMAGQPQLAECLGRSSMTQLRQRISFFIKLEPFTAEETEAYINHRLKVAGYTGPELFTPGAIRRIWEYSKGTPRTINNICFAAMSLAWMVKRRVMDRDTITDVLADLSPGLVGQRVDLVLATGGDAENEQLGNSPPPEDGAAIAKKVTAASAPGSTRGMAQRPSWVQLVVQITREYFRSLHAWFVRPPATNSRRVQAHNKNSLPRTMEARAASVASSRDCVASDSVPGSLDRP